MTRLDLAFRIDLIGMWERIDEIISHCIGEEDSALHDALRGFLVGELEANVITDDLLKELKNDAAAFADGWRYCEKYGGKHAKG